MLNNSGLFKKLFLSIFLFIILPQYLFGQLAQGNIFIGSDLSFYSESSSSEFNILTPGTNQLTGFSIAPEVGGFASKNVSLGLGFGYEYQSDKFAAKVGQEYSKKTTNIYDVNVFIRPYLSINENMALFLNTSVYFSGGTYKEVGKAEDPNLYVFYDYIIDGDLTLIKIGISPGFSFFLGKRFALEAKFGFIGYQYKKELYQTSHEEVVNLNKGFIANFSFSSLSFGLNYFIKR